MTKVNVMRSDISFRAIAVITHVTADKDAKRSKELEEQTGIPASKWKHIWTGLQRPTAHMIEAVARRWPQYAFWMATGITDEANGHTAPPETWTSSQNRSPAEIEIAATQYFELKILQQDLIYGTNGAASEQIESQNPSSKEILEAYLNDATIPSVVKAAFMNLDEGDDRKTKVYKKKYSELDDAIEKIAFNKRMQLLHKQYPFVTGADEYVSYLTELKALSSKRAKLELLDQSSDGSVNYANL